MTFPTSTVTDLANFLPEILDLPKEAEKHTLFLKDKLQDTNRNLNRKDTGCYYEVEQPTGQRFFGLNPQTIRYGYRKSFSFGAILAGATLNIPHNITGITTMTNLFGTIITAADQRLIPSVDVTNVTNQTFARLNGANITIVNGATAPNINSGIITIEFLKN